MPTYEYECTHCAHGFEKFQSMSEKAVQRCPECRHKVRRLFGSGAGIIFKGSGFYETDYKRSPASSASSEAKGDKSSSETKDTSKKSDSKSSLSE